MDITVKTETLAKTENLELVRKDMQVGTNTIVEFALVHRDGRQIELGSKEAKRLLLNLMESGTENPFMPKTMLRVMIDKAFAL